MTKSTAELVAALDAFGGQDTCDLKALDTLLAEALSLPPDAALDSALFGIFERFPEEDGHSVYWTLVHGLEGRGAYEVSLLASVRRAPSPFTLTMLDRIWNAGQTQCAGETIRSILKSVAGSPDASPHVRSEARRLLAHQQGRRE